MLILSSSERLCPAIVVDGSDVSAIALGTTKHAIAITATIAVNIIILFFIVRFSFLNDENLRLLQVRFEQVAGSHDYIAILHKDYFDFCFDIFLFLGFHCVFFLSYDFYGFNG